MIAANPTTATMGLAHSSFAPVSTGRYWIGMPVHTAIQGMRIHHPGRLIKVASLEDVPLLLHARAVHPEGFTIIYNRHTEKTVAVVRA